MRGTLKQYMLVIVHVKRWWFDGRLRVCVARTLSFSRVDIGLTGYDVVFCVLYLECVGEFGCSVTMPWIFVRL